MAGRRKKQYSTHNGLVTRDFAKKGNRWASSQKLASDFKDGENQEKLKRELEASCNI